MDSGFMLGVVKIMGLKMSFKHGNTSRSRYVGIAHQQGRFPKFPDFSLVLTLVAKIFIKRKWVNGEG
jgi:hypothetical protein